MVLMEQKASDKLKLFFKIIFQHTVINLPLNTFPISLKAHSNTLAERGLSAMVSNHCITSANLLLITVISLKRRPGVFFFQCFYRSHLEKHRVH